MGDDLFLAILMLEPKIYHCFLFACICHLNLKMHFPYICSALILLLNDVFLDYLWLPDDADADAVLAHALDVFFPLQPCVALFLLSSVNLNSNWQFICLMCAPLPAGGLIGCKYGDYCTYLCLLNNHPFMLFYFIGTGCFE